jgi:hypothetical protein
MSDDEYWNTIAPEFYERWLIGGNLAIDVAEEVYGGIGLGGENFWDYWENVYQKRLVAEADVEVVRPDLIARAMQPVSSDTLNALREITEMARKYWETQKN